MENLSISRDENKALERVYSLPEGVMINFQVEQSRCAFQENKDLLTQQLYKTMMQHKREYKLQNKVFKREIKKNLQNCDDIVYDKGEYSNWKKLRIVLKFCCYVNSRIMEQRLQGKTIQLKKVSSLKEQEEMFSLLSGYLLEKDDKVKRKNYIIYSDQGFSKIWLLINVIVLLILTFLLPYKIAFIDNEPKGLQIFENIVQILFSLDIILSFFTAFKQNDIYIDNLKLIAIGYLKTWFLIDVISVIPLEHFNFQSKELSQITKFLKILKILRLTRFIKISDNFKESQHIRRIRSFINVNKQFTEFFTFIIFIIVLTHLTGCLWFFIIKNYGQNNKWVNELQINFSTNSSQLYVLSFYWAITTICTVGFGDIYPTNLHEKIFCLVWIMVGVAFYTYTLSSLTTMVNSFYKRKLSISKRFQFLNEINKKNQIDQSVLEQLTIELEEQEQFSGQQQKYSGQNLLKDIPLDLTYQLTKNVNKELIEKVTVFHGKNLQFLTQLTPFFTQLKLQAGRVVYRKLDHATFIYFILKGKIGLFKNANLMFKTFQEGSYFGEIEIFKSSLRQYTVRVLEDCQLLILPGEVFLKNLKDFPEIDEDFHYIALRRNIEFSKAASQLEKISILNQNLGLNETELQNIDNNFSSLYQTTQDIKKEVNKLDNNIVNKRRKSIKLNIYQKNQLSILFSQQSFQTDEYQQKNFNFNDFQQSFQRVKNDVKKINKDLFKLLTKLKNKEIILKQTVEKKDQSTNINIADQQFLNKEDFSIEESSFNSKNNSKEYKEIQIKRKNNFFTKEFKNYFQNLQQNNDNIENIQIQSNSSRVEFLELNKQVNQIFQVLKQIHYQKIMSSKSENEFNDIIQFLLQLIQEANMDSSSIKSNSYIQDTSVSYNSENERQTISFIIKKMKTFKNNFNYLKKKYKEQNELIKKLQEQTSKQQEQIKFFELEKKDLKQVIYEQEQNNNYQSNEIQQLKKQQLQAQVLLTTKNINKPELLNQEMQIKKFRQKLLPKRSPRQFIIKTFKKRLINIRLKKLNSSIIF